MAKRGVGGTGSLQMWGSSPARNLLDFFEPGQSKPHVTEDSRDLNVFLFGEADLRHCLKTLADNWEMVEQGGIRFNFYVVENSLDLYARQMVLWCLAFEALEDKGLLDKTTHFMDLYGNLFIRPQTKKYLLRTCEKLIKLITGDEESASEFPIFSFSFLKYRERDQLVDIFRFWAKNSDSSKVDLTKFWVNRVRQHLGVRYDSRLGVFDWDYTMNLLDKGTPEVGVISLEEYKNWRNTGIGFGEYESDYSQPNLTLTAGATTSAHNYWGDIVTGPFVSHSIECPNGDYFTKTNNQFKSKAIDVTKYNLESIFSTISPKTTEERAKTVASAFKIHFVSPTNLCSMIIESCNFKEYFHMAYFGNSMVQYLVMKELVQVLRQESVVVVEDASFVLELRKEQVKCFDEKVLELAKETGLEPLETRARGDGNWNNAHSDEGEDTASGGDGPLMSTFCSSGKSKYFLKFHKSSESVVALATDTDEAVAGHN